MVFELVNTELELEGIVRESMRPRSYLRIDMSGYVDVTQYHLAALPVEITKATLKVKYSDSNKVEHTESHDGLLANEELLEKFPEQDRNRIKTEAEWYSKHKDKITGRLDITASKNDYEMDQLKPGTDAETKILVTAQPGKLVNLEFHPRYNYKFVPLFSGEEPTYGAAGIRKL